MSGALVAMLGSAPSPVNFVNSTAYVAVPSPDDATTGYNVTGGGLVTGDGLSSYTWLLSGANSDFAINAELNTGTVTSGAIGSWDVLSSTRSWTKVRTSNLAGLEEVILDMQVRRVSDSVVIAAWTVTIQAEVL